MLKVFIKNAKILLMFNLMFTSAKLRMFSVFSLEFCFKNIFCEQFFGFLKDYSEIIL